MPPYSVDLCQPPSSDPDQGANERLRPLLILVGPPMPPQPPWGAVGRQPKKRRRGDEESPQANSVVVVVEVGGGGGHDGEEEEEVEILHGWLVEVAEEYRLIFDTLYLTVSYIDRFLSANAINRQKLQLLVVFAMPIASKCEEINPPNVEDFCYITDNTYMKQVVKMESDILNLLKFEMGNPTTKTFLRMFIRSSQEDKKIITHNYDLLQLSSAAV